MFTTVSSLEKIDVSGIKLFPVLAEVREMYFLFAEKYKT